MPRQCPFRDCGAEINPILFACPTCWRKLSYDQKKMINDAYTAHLHDEIGPAELRRRQQRVMDEVQPRNLFQ